MSIPQSTQPPSAEDILRQYKLLLQSLVAALRAGARHAQAYAQWQDEDIDRMLGPALVRKGAKRYLLAKIKAVEVSDEEVEYETESLPNLGLAVAVNGVRIRILKSDSGSLPPPGPSIKRQQFYSQQGVLFGADGDSAAESLGVNLVLHWSTDDEYSLSRVYLACPKAGDTTRLSVEVHWDELIWRSENAFLAGDVRPSGEQVEAEADELDIYLDEEGTGMGQPE